MKNSNTVTYYASSLIGNASGFLVLKLFGTVVDDMHDICARERVSLRSLDSFESKIDFAEQKLLETLDIFTMIKGDYVRSKIR